MAPDKMFLPEKGKSIRKDTFIFTFILKLSIYKKK